jgi:DNA-binding response OmpR family regulator
VQAFRRALSGGLKVRTTSGAISSQPLKADERAARALARRCGAVDILVRPSPPDVMLAVVEAALETRQRTPGPPLDADGIERDHLRLVSSTLSGRIDRLEAARLVNW